MLKIIYQSDKFFLSKVNIFNSKSFHKILSCLSGMALKLPEGEYDTEPEKKVSFEELIHKLF